MITTKETPLSPQAQAGDRAFFGLLQRELALRRQAGAAAHLRHLLKLRVISEEPRGQDTLVKFKAEQRLTEYTTRLNAVNGEPLSWYIDFLSTEGDESLPAEAALEIARQTANPPADAQLQSAAYDASSGRTIFRARWIHLADGLPVEDDFIQVLVNAKAKKAFALTRFWRAPQPGGKAAER